MSGNNPFAALLDDEKLKTTHLSASDTLEEIFGFTINHQNVPKGRLYLEEVKNFHETTELDMNLINYALSERLFMCNENTQLTGNSEGHSHESKVLPYLYSCFKKLIELGSRLNPDDEVSIKDTILQNIATAIQPDIYFGQDVPKDMVDILKDNEPGAANFFVNVSNRIVIEDNNSM